MSASVWMAGEANGYQGGSMGGATRLGSPLIWIGGGMDGAVWQALGWPAQRGSGTMEKEGKPGGKARRQAVGGWRRRRTAAPLIWAEKNKGEEEEGGRAGFVILQKFRGLTVKQNFPLI